MKTDNYIQQIANEIKTIVYGDSKTQKELDDLFYSYALLALAKGEKVTDEDIHNAWSAWSTEHHPQHKSIVPFDDLPKSIQKLDCAFTNAVRKISQSL